ncbi:hypothetical protein QYM36_011614, partial [Artemia franciscana]
MILLIQVVFIFGTICKIVGGDVTSFINLSKKDLLQALSKVNSSLHDICHYCSSNAECSSNCCAPIQGKLEPIYAFCRIQNDSVIPCLSDNVAVNFDATGIRFKKLCFSLKLEANKGGKRDTSFPLIKILADDMKDIHSPAPTQPNPLGYKTDKISNNREGLEVSK